MLDLGRGDGLRSVRINSPVPPGHDGDVTMKTNRPTLLRPWRIPAVAALLLSPAAASLAQQAPAPTNKPPEGLVLHFDFAAAPTNNLVVDVSGRGNNGRIAGASWTAAGRVGGGCQFGGTDHFIAVPGSPSLSSKHATFMVWIKAADGTTGRTLLDRHAGQGFALTLGEGATGMRGKALAYVAGRSCASDNAVSDNFWHHLAATYDGETLKLYVDGVAQKQSSAWKGEIGAAGRELTVGANRSNPSPEEKGVSYQGVLDEVQIYDRALAATDITAIFSATKPKFSKSEVSRRIAELKELKDRGLLLDEFFARKMKECEQ